MTVRQLLNHSPGWMGDYQQDFGLGLDHSRFFSDEVIGFNVAASHKLVDGNPVVDPSFWRRSRAASTRPAA